MTLDVLRNYERKSLYDGKFQNENQGQMNWSSDWYVTRYFTPKESDYSGLKKTIFVHELGNIEFL